ncbi:hypothetical protein HK101_009884 [Irineochytrium annulatum]|nr:hypothetical protein HK101_009884 [Irineochytrium annulatum]
MTTRVYIGRLAKDAREDDVDGLFKVIGDIKEINLKNGFGFVEFTHEADAEKACKDINGTSFFGERLIVELSRGDKRKPVSHSTSKYGPPQRTNFRCIIENLSSSVSWQDLKDFMRRGGDVVYSDAHRFRDGEGVVEFATLDDLRNAIRKLDGEELKGRRVTLIEDESLTSRVRQPSPLKRGSGATYGDSANDLRGGARDRSRSPVARRRRSASPPTYGSGGGGYRERDHLHRDRDYGGRDGGGRDRSPAHRDRDYHRERDRDYRGGDGGRSNGGGGGGGTRRTKHSRSRSRSPPRRSRY